MRIDVDHRSNRFNPINQLLLAGGPEEGTPDVFAEDRLVESFQLFVGQARNDLQPLQPRNHSPEHCLIALVLALDMEVDAFVHQCNKLTNHLLSHFGNDGQLVQMLLPSRDLGIHFQPLVGPMAAVYVIVVVRLIADHAELVSAQLYGEADLEFTYDYRMKGVGPMGDRLLTIDADHDRI